MSINIGRVKKISDVETQSKQLVLHFDKYVSPIHGRIKYEDGKIIYEDLGSLNGTYTNIQGIYDVGTIIKINKKHKVHLCGISPE